MTIYRALHARTQQRIAPNYIPMQFRHAKGLLLDLIEQPDKHIEHARRYAASVIMSMTYGKSTPTYYSDPDVQGVVKGGMRLGQLLSQPQTVDKYPLLRYIPWVTSTVRQWHRDELDLFQGQVDSVRKQIVRRFMTAVTLLNLFCLPSTMALRKIRSFYIFWRIRIT